MLESHPHQPTGFVRVTRDIKGQEMTAEVKHTPGPWEAVKAAHGPIDIFDQRGRDVVTVYGGGVEAESKSANANLIAAAPDLLEALIDCVERFTAAFPAAENYEPIKKARAAIAKAIGGQ